MHKYLRAIGFSMYQNKREVERLLKDLIDKLPEPVCIQTDTDVNYSELRYDVAPGMGLVICGEKLADEGFRIEYYYPYLAGYEPSSTADCMIQRHVEKETYAGLLDEYKVGISLIFYLENAYEYRERIFNKESTEVKFVSLVGLCNEGKILLPVQKNAKQIEKSRVASKDRSSLIEAAKNGDEDAMETLTIEDIDLYSQISRRVIREDIYSIIDSCFMPSGVECDIYSVIGDIKSIEIKKNNITDEEVYNLMIESNDMVFNVVINKKDMQGEPAVGRRFKGQVWMQGRVRFKD